tara:strand:+ start:1215 stop:1958 length:744 start_codon:yes stop_codon:yes gene_type:complete
MSAFSQHLEDWRQSKVDHLTSEVGYMYFDIQKNKYLGSSSNLAWRSEFHEKDLDISGINLLNEGCFILPNNSVIKSAYNNLEQTQPDSYKTLFCRRDNFGFELFGVVTQKELSNIDQIFMNKSLFNLSYKVSRWVKNKTSIFTDIKAYDLAKNKFDQCSGAPEIVYDKSKFRGNLILTTKEQQYIEYLLFNFTKKDIAYKHQCSETAVSNVITNIKRKLGYENMATPMMMIKLKELGVLGIYAQALI